MRKLEIREKLVMAGHYGTVASTLRRGLHEPSTYELQLFGRLNSNYPSLKQQLFVHSTYFRLVKIVQEIIHTYNPINYSEMMMHLKMNQLGGHYT